MPKLKTVISCENNILTVILKGEIDHHTITDVRDEVDGFIFANTPKKIILDFENVSFMDSSGIGFIIGRSRTAKTYGGDVIVRNPPSPMKKVIVMAGLESLIEIVD